MGHLMRCVPAIELAPYADLFDERVRGAFGEIAGIGTGGDGVPLFLQAKFKDGGFVSPAANIASLLLCLPFLIRFAPGLQTMIDDFKAQRDAPDPPEKGRPGSG
jgi:hypothetical protein